jgi:hypothetical protein
LFDFVDFDFTVGAPRFGPVTGISDFQCSFAVYVDLHWALLILHRFLLHWLCSDGDFVVVDLLIFDFVVVVRFLLIFRF